MRFSKFVKGTIALTIAFILIVSLTRITNAQLRKRGIDKVILAGMSANLCTESHMRELLEQGFEVAVVKDATAAAIIPDGDGSAAVTNFRFMANAVWTTEEAKQALNHLAASK